MEYRINYEWLFFYIDEEFDVKVCRCDMVNKIWK